MKAGYYFSSVAIGKPEPEVHKASHCGNKQRWRSHAAITLLLLVSSSYIWVLFFTHITFMMNRTFSVTPMVKLKHQPSKNISKSKNNKDH